MTTLTVSVLGFPAVQVNDAPVSFPTRKALALLIFLAVERTPIPRTVLTALLWPESATPQASGAFRKTLSRLRVTLQHHQAAGVELLHTTRDSVALHPRLDLNLDLSTVQAALSTLGGWTPLCGRTESTQPNSLPADPIPLLEAAIQSYRGDFLAGFSLSDAPEFDTWISVQRETWHQRMGRIFAQLTLLYQSAGDLQRTIAIAQRWVAHDPLHETAHRALIAAHAAAGDRAAAIRAYTMCCALLNAEMGLAPEPATEALAATLRSWPAAQVIPATKHN